MVFLEPSEHLSRRVLHGLVERPGIADREDVIIVLAPRPATALALPKLNRELDLEGNLDTGAYDLAVALDRVPIAHVQECAQHKHRKVDRHARGEAAIVHVAAMLSRCGSR